MGKRVNIVSIMIMLVVFIINIITFPALAADNTHNDGNNSAATADNATAVGDNSRAEGSNSTAIGQGSYTQSTDSTAVGDTAKAYAPSSTALGKGTNNKKSRPESLQNLKSQAVLLKSVNSLRSDSTDFLTEYRLTFLLRTAFSGKGTGDAEVRGEYGVTGCRGCAR